MKEGEGEDNFKSVREIIGLLDDIEAFKRELSKEQRERTRKDTVPTLSPRDCKWPKDPPLSKD